MRRFFGLIAMFLFVALAFAPCSATTYYIDSQSGDDAASGTSPQSAWKTLVHPNEVERFHAGDQILFKRGGLWYGNLRIALCGEKDAPLLYSSYGEGEKPRIYGSISLNSPDLWVKGGENLWYAELDKKEVRDIGNIILNGDRAAWKRWGKEDVAQQNDFWFDLYGDQKLWIYSDINPAEKYASIEAAARRNIIEYTHCQWVMIDGLELRYGAAHGMGGSNVSHITVRNCDLSWIGGGDLYLADEELNVRYGNGIEFWESASDCLVENCRLWEIYDAALSNQGKVTHIQRNLTYRNNEVWNCENSYEFWSQPADSLTENILVENNIFRDAGYGWGHIQRPDPNGRHFLVYNNASVTRNFLLQNNLFHHATDSLVRVDRCKGNPEEEFKMRNNTYEQIEGKPIFFWKGENRMDDPTNP